MYSHYVSHEGSLPQKQISERKESERPQPVLIDEYHCSWLMLCRKYLYQGAGQEKTSCEIKSQPMVVKAVDEHSCQWEANLRSQVFLDTVEETYEKKYFLTSAWRPQ